MSINTVIGAEQGRIYGIIDSGRLLYYKDDARDGTSHWSYGGTGQEVGQDWAQFSQVIGGGDGIFYALTSNGDLKFYKDVARDGTFNWDPKSGTVINSGWNRFAKIFYGGDQNKPGIIYAIEPGGDLYYFRDLARDGTSSWEHGGEDKKIGTGWHIFVKVFGGADGIVYGINQDGQLMFYQDLARDGTGQWAFGGVGAVIGYAWTRFAQVFYGGDNAKPGIIYGLEPSGDLYYYRDLARNGSGEWEYRGQGQRIQRGWDVSDAAGRIEGYCWPLSIAPGGPIDFKVSCAAPYTVTYRRLNTVLTRPEDDTMGVAKLGPLERAASPQNAPPASAFQAGYGWSTSFSLDSVPNDWESGVYAAHVQTASHDDYIVFIVKPAPNASRSGRLAVLANTNTWNAYNGTGGQSKYEGFEGYKLSFERPNPLTRPLRGVAVEGPSHQNHLTAGELWVLNWLEESGYGVDVYADRDFHDFSDADITALTGYGALLLNTHPEYWTARMFDNLEKYLKAGGTLIYLAGNGVFEHVEYEAGTRRAIYLEGDNTNDAQELGSRNKAYLRNLTRVDEAGHTVGYMAERALLGVAFRYDNAYWAGGDDGKPFAVLDSAHFVFEGTGLANGDTFGARGYNGSASGWELDTSLSGAAPDGVLVKANAGFYTDPERRGKDNLTDDRGVPPGTEAPSTDSAVYRPGNFKLLARGTNTGYGADMTYYETGLMNNGHKAFVFAAGAISVGGSLVVDAKLQKIVQNVLQACGVTPS